MPTKKEIRAAFREAVFKRDKYRCVMCGRPASTEVKLDAHHIQNRNLLPNGGYVLENGITLCDCEAGCHLKAEQFHATGKAYPGFSPADLYAKIGSSHEKAVKASQELS
jgi:hypothetical protein